MKPLDEFQAFIANNPDIERFDGYVFDLGGHPRGKKYTRAAAEKIFQNGAMVSNSIFLMDVTGAVLDARGKGFSDGDPDGAAHVVPGSIKRIPWASQPTAQFMMTMTDKDHVLPTLDPRLILQKTLEKLSAYGFRATAAFETEFYLTQARNAADGSPVRLAASPDQPQVYDLASFGLVEGFIEDIIKFSEAQNLPITVTSSEYGRGQFEANLLHGDALAAADDCLNLRRLIKAVAARHNLRATFMAKPFLDDSGNGTHINISLADENGHNVFFQDNGMSKTMRHAIGGCQAALAESVAIFAPNQNAYRRYITNHFVPVNKHWGISNRSVAFRAMLGDARAQRIEHRFASADVNAYLGLAAVIAAIMHGIGNKIEPSPEAKGNACDQVDPDLPLIFDDALERAATAQILPQYLGDYLSYYVDAKRRELDKLRRCISALEYQWYL